MNFLQDFKISTKVFVGFGSIFLLLVVIALVGYSSLGGADENFQSYRSLARQTNEAGRIQANMLMTRMGVKNFIITANKENISDVHSRAQTTLDLIPHARELTTDPEFLKVVDTVEEELNSYVSYFNMVTKKQALRNDLVNDKLNVTGPQMEKKLSAIMKSAFDDGDADAAYRAGMTLRNLLLARLYVVKFLVDNDTASYERVMQEMADMDKNQEELLVNLQNPTRRQLAEEIESLHQIYVPAFESVYKAINERNAIINDELDRIGPEIADQIEQLKLAIKGLQDDLGPKAEASINAALITLMVVSGVAFVFGILAAVIVGKGISSPVVNMTNAMTRLANGDKQSDIPAQNRKDEIGLMAKAVQVFKDNMIKTDQLAAEQEDLKRKTEEQRKAALNHMAQTFEDSVSGIVSIVSSSSTELEASAEQMAHAADGTNQLATTVAAAAEQASANVQTVASSAEELSSSISEISRQVAQSTQVAGTAVVEVDSANTKVQGLAEAANKIGEVVALITDIADQTNLLALNATIEAARAGEAGKGFAVVASEVKNLANQTAKATEEISTQISGIQGATQDAVSAIGSIGGIINQMNEISSTIAAAVEEQGAATQEIARNVEQASTGTQEVTSNIQRVKTASEESGGAASDVSGAASELSKQSETLRGEVNRFLSEVRTDNKSSELYKWDESLATGVDKIDREHQECMEDLNTFHTLMLSGQGEAGLNDMIDRLQNHVTHHFKDEEEYMNSINYPDLAVHKREHQEFSTRLEELKADLKNSGHNTSADTEFYNYVAQWMTNHFSKADKEYVVYARNR